MTFTGAKSFEVEVAFDYSCGALRSTLKFANLCKQGQSQIWIGASKSYINTDEHNLLCYIQKNLKDSYVKIKKHAEWLVASL